MTVNLLLRSTSASVSFSPSPQARRRADSPFLPVITWENLHQRAVHLLETLLSLSDQAKAEWMAKVNLHADRVRKETSLVKLRKALEQRKKAVEVSWKY